MIAHAKAKVCTIVTEETRKGPHTLDKNQKIPHIADEHGVKTINFIDYVRKHGWRF